MTHRKLSGVFLALVAALALALPISMAVGVPAVKADASVGAAYVPYGPMRFVDTRFNNGISGKLPAFSSRTFQVAGLRGIPVNAVAVTGNLVAVNQVSSGYLALTTTPNDHPGTSSLNYPAGDIRANGDYAPLSPTGTLSIMSMTTTDVVYDITGYFVTSGGATWVPLAPTRFLDSRLGGAAAKFKHDVPQTLQIAGVHGIPANAVAVSANIAVVNQTAGGYVAVTATPTTTPGTSTINFPVGDIRANNLTAPLGPDGSIAMVFMSYAGTSTDVVVDVTGYFLPDASGALYYPVGPNRIADSRYNNGINGPVSTGTSVTLAVLGPTSGVGANALAVTGNLAVTGGQGGWAAVTPSAFIPNGFSTINFPVGDTRANGFVVALSQGTLGISFMGSGTTQIVVDINGYFAGGTTPAPVRPTFSGMSLYRYSAWSHQATQTWCTGASTQMMINLVYGNSDHASSSQSAYVTYAYYHSRYVARAGAEIDGWANALTYYGAGTYTVGAYASPDIALKAAATRMRITGKPVGLVVMEGHHAWVMAGFTSTGDDPAVSQNFTLTSVIIMAPDYGSISYDPYPGSAESLAYMRTKLTGYTDDYPTIWDHQFAIIQP